MLWNAVLLLLALALPGFVRAQADATATGEMIYRQGVLPSGQPLHGERRADMAIDGAAAACVNCHRRSGLGTSEGETVIVPITGKYLFRPNGMKSEDMDFQYAQRFYHARGAYADDAALARAIREGIGRDGRALSELMPRFKLDEASMAALIGYLKNLSKDLSPGVVDGTLHFATIITPDADPVERRAMLQVMEQFFADKNEFIRGGIRPMRGTGEIKYRVSRKWQLHVWDLNGPPETWEKQLHERLAAEPVFAVISGLGNKTWAPVHRFCESAAIPCLLPNIDLPVVAENDYYSVYFSQGVLLEAQLIARQISKEHAAKGVRRIIQVYREGDIGAQPAAALAQKLSDAKLPVVSRVLAAARPARAGAELAQALRDSDSGDVIVLWLRPDDIRALPAGVPRSAVVFMSGTMGGLEQAPLSAAWRGVTQMAYPFDLPELRKVRMNFPLGWFKVRHIPVVAERVQSDTYIACGVLSDALSRMLDSFYRDYLLERIENMMSTHQVSGYYPRFGLAPGQRFAAKGGYLVHFAAPEGTALVADSDWTIP